MIVTKCNKLLQYVNTQFIILAVFCLIICANEAQAASCVEVVKPSRFSSEIQQDFTQIAERVWQYCPERLNSEQKYVIHLVDYIEDNVKQPYMIQSPYQLKFLETQIKLKVEKWQGTDLLWKRVLQLQLQNREMFQTVQLTRQSVFEQLYRLKQGLSHSQLNRVSLRQELLFKGLQKLFFEARNLQQRANFKRVPS